MGVVKYKKLVDGADQTGASCGQCFTQPAIWEHSCPVCTEFFCSDECLTRHMLEKAKPAILGMPYGRS